MVGLIALVAVGAVIVFGEAVAHSSSPRWKRGRLTEVGARPRTSGVLESNEELGGR